jgi:hypothetical protein
MSMSDTKKPDARRGNEEPRAGDASAREGSQRERRATHRVSDDQASGRGSASALSKWKMIERRRAMVPRRQD